MVRLKRLPLKYSASDKKKQHAPLIEDHGLIGNLHTAALIDRQGTIDWLCVPDFDKDACFASLVGTKENGYWSITSIDPIIQESRKYLRNTLILESAFATQKGSYQITDFMPPKTKYPTIVRRVTCLEGSVSLRSDLVARFSYGFAVPRVSQEKDTTVMVAGPDALYLTWNRDKAPSLIEEFVLKEGEEVCFVLSYMPSYLGIADQVDPRQAEKDTKAYWQSWSQKIMLPKRYQETVMRSLITLKACIFEPSGGIVAAPTTSLPETIGGSRNWDYRYCWLRDASLTLQALITSGLSEEASAFWHWLVRAVGGDASQLQIMYGLRGERHLSESELSWLSGYEKSKPVRIGNAAYNQFQLDVLGEVADAIYQGMHLVDTKGVSEEKALLRIAEYVEKHWRELDHGIWEMRGPKRAFTASKVSAWLAVTRAIQVTTDRKVIGRLEKVRDEIFEEVLEKGFGHKRNTFTQYYGGKTLDASLLFIPLSGFLSPNDPKVIGTVKAIEEELLEDGLLLRYRPVESIDGLVGNEGVFLACSFWLVDTYEMMGRHKDARELFEHLLSLQNDLGLLAEEYDPIARRQLGNFPQAFSHFALVRAAYLLAEQENVKKKEPVLHQAGLRS